jgi:hypothetical protein
MSLIIAIALIIGAVGAKQDVPAPAPDYQNPDRPACVWFAAEDSRLGAPPVSLTSAANGGGVSLMGPLRSITKYCDEVR